MSEYIVDVGNADEEYIEHFGYMATAYADNPIRELIVRCKDCRYYQLGIYRNITCELFECHTEPSDFCSQAERKDENERGK